jgi:glycosyltransferase involved in cell wall biosynthesis
MIPAKPASVVDYKWKIRKNIARRLPLPVRKWIMSKYHRFFYYFDRCVEFISLSINWRGQEPRIFFPIHKAGVHVGWRMYITNPPLRYAPQPLAQLCHWVNSVPENPHKPCVAECEHILALAGDITNWQTGLQNLDRINRLVAQPQCRFVFTYSRGLVEHSRRYLHADLWHKFGHIYQAFPQQPAYPKPDGSPFNILVIASRFSDKGVPEALGAFAALRQRYGADVQLSLVCQMIPVGYRLPAGVIHYDTPRMSDQLKVQVYHAAHVLYIPCYSDTTGCFLEACAFGVPILTTRIHHGDEFVQDGVTGYLIDPPVYSYSERYGTRWKLWEDFLVDLDAMRQRGELQTVVDQSIDRLDALFNHRALLDSMGRAALTLHAERFSPEVRNRKLRRLYEAALTSETQFPE